MKKIFLACLCVTFLCVACQPKSMQTDVPVIDTTVVSPDTTSVVTDSTSVTE